MSNYQQDGKEIWTLKRENLKRDITIKKNQQNSIKEEKYLENRTSKIMYQKAKYHENSETSNKHTKNADTKEILKLKQISKNEVPRKSSNAERFSREALQGKP